jgi:hypothetical protein
MNVKSVAAALAALTLLATSVSAQEWPAKNVTLIGR